jgi:hypothetical protein
MLNSIHVGKQKFLKVQEPSRKLPGKPCNKQKGSW